MTDSADPEGLRVFYYLVQDLKALVFSLISLHFKVCLGQLLGSTPGAKVTRSNRSRFGVWLLCCYAAAITQEINFSQSLAPVEFLSMWSILKRSTVSPPTDLAKISWSFAIKRRNKRPRYISSSSGDMQQIFCWERRKHKAMCH